MAAEEVEPEPELVRGGAQRFGRRSSSVEQADEVLLDGGSDTWQLAAGAAPLPSAPRRRLTPARAADMLAVERDWVYANADQLGAGCGSRAAAAARGCR